MPREQARAACEALGRSGLAVGTSAAERGLHQVLEALSAAAAHQGRECVVCGAEMQGRNPRQQTCSDRCRQALSRSKRAAPPAADPAPPSRLDRDSKDPAAALMACRRLLTPSVVGAIGALVERLPDLDPHAWKYRLAPVANDYLKSGREGLPDGLWREVEALAGDGPGFRHLKLRAIAVGCMLRLPDLGQPIPTDPAAFVEWSGLALLVDQRQASSPALSQ